MHSMTHMIKSIRLRKPSEIAQMERCMSEYRQNHTQGMSNLTYNHVVCCVAMFYCFPRGLVMQNSRNAELVNCLCKVLGKHKGTIQRYKNAIPTLYSKDSTFRKKADEYINYVEMQYIDYETITTDE